MTGSKKLRNRKPKVPSPRSSKAQLVDEHATDSALRKTGIRFTGDVPWGAHLYIFYETKEDLLDTLVSYHEAGLDNNEFCLWRISVSNQITVADAKSHFRRTIDNFDERLSAGQIEIIDDCEWGLKGDRFDLKRITKRWSEKISSAFAKGYDGMRVSGNPLWLGTKQWKEFYEYEREIDQVLAGQKMIALGTCPLHASRAVDILDVTRVNHISIARRNGNWEFLETPDLKQARLQIQRLNGALDLLSKPSTGNKSLTPRERVVLAQIVRGASSKEAARTLGVSPRTIEFHRTNIMQKLGAKNTVDMVRRVLGE
jgi:DNA-binding CsgD family transcriptional regulator